MSVNETLLLIGHGSARYPDAGAAMLRHAETLRGMNRFAGIEVALLNGSPSVADALAAVRSRAIRVVPFFMEDGYFARVAVPRAIGDARQSASWPAAAHDQTATAPTIAFAPPIGIHDGLAGIIERQALAGCSALGVPSHTAAIVVIGHGSARAPGRALALHRHAGRVAGTTLFARVEAACLEEPPLVAGVLARLRAHPVVIVGFFANQGGHVRDDVPALVAAERASSGRAIRFHGCVADDPAMTQIILDQAGEE